MIINEKIKNIGFVVDVCKRNREGTRFFKLITIAEYNVKKAAENEKKKKIKADQTAHRRVELN